MAKEIICVILTEVFHSPPNFILGLVFFFISFPLFYWAIKVSDKKQDEKEMREKEQQETNQLIREMLEQKRAEQSSGSNNNQ
ncbi:MAG: hypothetical protein NC405_05280 [Odoribacter sp.]|nr:hypothetical protein [Odoribacter sp.]